MERIRSVMQREPDGTPGILSKDQLRNSKNMFIAGITLFTRAAIEGGVPEETAYSLSDGYIQTVEECADRDSIEKLSAKAAERFAQEVRKYGNPSYSRAMECAVRYIHLHLHNPITLEEVSKAAGISSSYLSRTFRKRQECPWWTIFRNRGLRRPVICFPIPIIQPRRSENISVFQIRVILSEFLKVYGYDTCEIPKILSTGRIKSH